jgi:lipopolysaccharide transport system ATP-binding protein
MNSDNIAIKVKNLSKQYRIGLKEESSDSIGSTILNFIKSPLKNYRKHRSLYKFSEDESLRGPDPNKNHSDIIWGLRDVSFEVEKGEVIGIIGSNGAGKSTLLKILSRITSPTAGYAEIRGKVSSLLEVGTGFHPELTGRDNLYLNGAILGMTKKEMDSKFDEIVDFSGVEKFIDTPVKRYSSGMKVRLAFSVAAHIEPEILLIDEVLAVGDIAFQRKCLGKMDNVAKTGKTILFVSHNMAAVTTLCPKSILLENGCVKSYGSSNEIVKNYIVENTKTEIKKIADRTDRDGDGRVKITDLWIENETGEVVDAIGQKDIVRFNIGYAADDNYKNMEFKLTIYDDYDQRLFRFDTQVKPAHVEKWPKVGTVSCRLATSMPVRPGKYRIMVSVLVLSTIADRIGNAKSFDVIEGDYFGSGKNHKYWPMFLIDHDWMVHSN